MSERAVTLLGALISLLLVAALFLPRDPGVSRPRSVESGANGYQAMARWLELGGVSTLSHRKRFTSLHELPARNGNVLVVTLPFAESLQAEEVVALWSWLADGNTLLLLAALDDTPDWTRLVEGDSFLDDLEALSGVRFEAVRGADETIISIGQTLATTEIVLRPVASTDHPLLGGVLEVTMETDLLTSLWRPVDGSPGTALLATVDHDVCVAWERAIGSGHLVLMGSATAFGNRLLGRSDNATLLANVARWHLSAGGTVVFDDMHQGLSELYDPEAFFSDPRLGYSVLFLLAFWLVYMIGTHNRLLPVRPARPEPQQADHVRAMGGFLARKLSAVDAGRELLAGWLLELETRAGFAAGDPWQRLAASRLVDERLLARLRHSHEQLSAGRRVDLRLLHNDINQIREALG